MQLSMGLGVFFALQMSMLIPAASVVRAAPAPAGKCGTGLSLTADHHERRCCSSAVTVAYLLGPQGKERSCTGRWEEQAESCELRSRQFGSAGKVWTCSVSAPEFSASVTSADPRRCDSNKRRPLLAQGLSQSASNALVDMGMPRDQVGQTIGRAQASAGTHDEDGVDPCGRKYSAAVDLSVRRPRRLSVSQISALLEELGRHGFAAFYRDPGRDHWPADQVEHIHAVYVGLPMKAALRTQVRDWLDGRNGLASHATYEFWRPSPAAETAVAYLLKTQ